MKLEEKLVSLRKEKGLSQLKLAEMMNVSRQAISRWEVGATVPSTDNLKYLGRLYNVPLEYLLHDDAPEPDRVSKSTEETTTHQKKRIRIVLIAIGIVVVAICVMYFWPRGEKPVPMNDIEGSETDMDRENDFELEW